MVKDEKMWKPSVNRCYIVMTTAWYDSLLQIHLLVLPSLGGKQSCGKGAYTSEKYKSTAVPATRVTPVFGNNY